ncbi:MAG: hypothetical protein ACOYB3_12865, partial [Azonexus sp.]
THRQLLIWHLVAASLLLGQERADELRQQVARLEGDLARLAGTKAAENEPRKRGPAASEIPPE